MIPSMVPGYAQFPRKAMRLFGRLALSTIYVIVSSEIMIVLLEISRLIDR